MKSDDPPPTPIASGRDFRTTHWSVVVLAGQPNTPQSAQALEKLCRDYWYPLYAYVRRRGCESEQARDLTQAFFAHLIEKNVVGSADADRGKFRTFLLCSMNNFVAKEWEREHRLKRGGGREMISLDAGSVEERYQLEPVDALTPEMIYERRWAETLLELVLARLRSEYESTAAGRRFDDVQTFIVEERGAVPFADVAARLKMSEAGAKSVVHRLRKRYRELVREEIANTVSSPAEIETELRHLLQALS